MIRRILTYYAERLDEYLSRTRHQPEGLAAVGLTGIAGMSVWKQNKRKGEKI